MFGKKTISWRCHMTRGAAILVSLGAAISISAQQPVVDADAWEHADALSRAFRQAASHVIPTVVTIRTSSRPRSIADPRGMDEVPHPFEGTPWEQFFGEGFGQQIIPRREGLGSGVIIDASGIVLTNNHVVDGMDSVVVGLADGREFTATDIKTDPQSDLAVLRITNAGQLPAATLGDSDALQIGDWVLAVGSPFGLDETVSAGIISAKGRALQAAERAQFLQTDAAINPGNSGGPLVNLRGEVVGINTAIASRSGVYQAAIPGVGMDCGRLLRTTQKVGRRALTSVETEEDWRVWGDGELM